MNVSNALLISTSLALFACSSESAPQTVDAGADSGVGVDASSGDAGACQKAPNIRFDGPPCCDGKSLSCFGFQDQQTCSCD